MSCINCEYFNESQYYADNQIVSHILSFGSCTKEIRNICNTNPLIQIPNWCPVEGGKND